MIQLIKKGGLRERANRSRSYHGSENTETTLAPHHYQLNNQRNDQCLMKPDKNIMTTDTQPEDVDSFKK